ncbi:MAG TPA: HAMP domain-containing sensor histidine kinase, partial [Kofleriaceae bacterium]|nr:HAMP domain-containing sensor histidine kinase [Kofleriaceae bacterium]
MTLLLLSMVLADIVVARGVARRTDEIVNDEQRSIELIYDLNEQADRIATPGLSADQLAVAAKQIAADSAEYEPLTAQPPSERQIWEQLRAHLGELDAAARARDLASMTERAAEIHRSIHRLTRINQAATRGQVEKIRTIHSNAIAADAAIGLLTLFVVAVIVFFVLRVLARQRALAADHIALLSQRNRDLDAFAGRAAHDLLVPLNPMRGYADLLVSSNEPPEHVQQMALRIRTAVDRMAELVENMLALSRAGHPSPGVSSPAKVAADVVAELGPQLADAQVTLACDDEAVHCAPGVMAQLLRNLVTNAAKFRSPDRRLVLTLRTARADHGVDLTVEDNGLGMSDEVLEHAFEPFYRGKETRDLPGHGLGLAIVQRTMLALGGTCELSRSSSGGTVVVLRFQRAGAPGSPMVLPAHQDLAPGAPRRHRHGMRAVRLAIVMALMTLMTP